MVIEKRVDLSIDKVLFFCYFDEGNLEVIDVKGFKITTGPLKG